MEGKVCYTVLLHYVYTSPSHSQCIKQRSLVSGPLLLSMPCGITSGSVHLMCVLQSNIYATYDMYLRKVSNLTSSF